MLLSPACGLTDPGTRVVRIRVPFLEPGVTDSIVRWLILNQGKNGSLREHCTHRMIQGLPMHTPDDQCRRAR